MDDRPACLNNFSLCVCGIPIGLASDAGTKDQPQHLHQLFIHVDLRPDRSGVWSLRDSRYPRLISIRDRARGGSNGNSLQNSMHIGRLTNSRCWHLYRRFGPSLSVLEHLANDGQFYGRRPIYIISLVFFVIWIIPSAVAKNIQTMLIARFIDGVAGSAFLRYNLKKWGSRKARKPD